MADKSKSSEEGQAAAAPVKKKKSKLVLIIALILVLGAGSAGGYIFFIRNPANVKAAAQKGKKKEIAPAPDEDTAEDEEVDKKGKDKGETRKDKANKPAISLPEDEDVKQVIEIPSFILNLADQDDNRFLRLTLSLGVGDESSEKPDAVFLTRVRNAVLAVLMTKTSNELLSADGKSALRRELLEAIRTAAKAPQVQAVYITELIVQR